MGARNYYITTKVSFYWPTLYLCWLRDWAKVTPCTVALRVEAAVMGKSKSLLDLNHDRITSGNLTWVQEDLIWEHVIWFWFDLSLSRFDLWFEQIKSQSLWADRSWTQCSTTFADSHMPIKKANSSLFNRSYLCFLYDFQIAFRKIWLPCVFSSGTFKISELKI